MTGEQEVFEAWLDRERPSGNGDQVQYQEWLEDQKFEFTTTKFETWLIRVRNEVISNASLVVHPKYLVVPEDLHNLARRILLKLHWRKVRSRLRGVRGRAYSLKWSRP